MKKIINGRKYDTDTAREVGYWSNTSDFSDFHWCCETLYRKRTGEYFLYGEGGAMSRYAQACGQNSWCGGDRIMPMTYDEATQWAEDHLDADEYEAEFGEVSEDDSEVMISVRVSATAKTALDREVARTGRTQGDILTELLRTL